MITARILECVIWHDMFLFLFLQGADITRQTKKGETLKDLALFHKHTSIVALIDKHMSPQEPTRKEASMLYYEYFLYFDLFKMRSFIIILLLCNIKVIEFIYL